MRSISDVNILVTMDGRLALIYLYYILFIRSIRILYFLTQNDEFI